MGRGKWIIQEYAPSHEYGVGAGRGRISPLDFQIPEDQIPYWAKSMCKVLEIVAGRRSIVPDGLATGNAFYM